MRVTDACSISRPEKEGHTGEAQRGQTHEECHLDTQSVGGHRGLVRNQDQFGCTLAKALQKENRWLFYWYTWVCQERKDARARTGMKRETLE